MTSYVCPEDPDAPQVGDLVVVVIDGAPGTGQASLQDDVGIMGAVISTTQHAEEWGVHHRWDVDGAGWVHAVRRPTPEELAAHRLEGP